MYHENHPDGGYEMANQVLAFDPPRVISWKPGYVSPETGELEFGGWIWRHDLTPIGPDETDTIAHIPRELLFPAPRMPGHQVLGYDERGHCPMLVDGACTIYEHRPRTCRTYDCRVLTAAEITLDDADKAVIAERVKRWRFSHPSSADERAHRAVRDAAAFLEAVVQSETQRAVYAVEISDEFLDGPAPADPDAIRAKLRPASTD